MTNGNATEPEDVKPVAPEIAPRERRLARIKSILLGLIVLMLVPFLVPTAQRVGAGLGFPYQLDSEEGFVLWQAWRLRNLQPIFRPLHEPPYVAATYGPVYPLLSAATLWGKQPAFFGGRLLAALSVVAICLFLGLIVWSETRALLPVLLAPLLFLNSYDVYQWLPFYRVDFTALALGLAGLWLLSGRREIGTGRFRGACACFVAMVYTKQVELAPFVAAVIYFAVRDRRLARRLFITVAAWGIGIALVLTLLTRGQFLVHNVYYNANPFSWWQLKTTVVGRTLEDGRFVPGFFYLFHRFLIVGVIVCIVWYLVERLRPRSEWAGRLDGESGPGEDEPTPPEAWGRLGLYAAYALVASVGVLGLGKIGAATNYLIEPKAAWALLIAVVLGKTLRPLPATGKPLGVRPVFFPVIVVLALHAFEFLASSTLYTAALPYLRDPNRGGLPAKVYRSEFFVNYLRTRPPVLLAQGNRNPTSLDRLNGNRIVQILEDAPEPVFCEHAIFPMLSGHEVFIQPFIMSELAEEEKWDETPVVEALARGEFSIIQSTEDIFREGFLFHYTDAMTSAIRTTYTTREVLGPRPDRPAVLTHYLLEPEAAASIE